LADQYRPGLSDRATRFLHKRGRTLPVDRRPSVANYPQPDFIADGAPETLISEARRYASKYGGLRFSVPGGVLEGQLWLAARQPTVVVQRASDGSYMFLAADHSDAQCGLMISESGAFGCSWAWEFGKLFDSVEHLIECIALWDLFAGWVYVAIFPGEPAEAVAAMGGMVADEASAGSTSSWWVGASSAVVVEPFLTTTASDTSVVTVLARNRDKAAQLKQLLSGRASIEQGFTTALIRSEVGMRV
jgi:hypothetical protein